MFDNVTVLIDGDILIYRISAVNETVTEWDDEVWTLSGDAKKAKADVDDAIEKIVDQVGATDYIVVLSDKKNFRHDVYPQYKGNRKGTRKPILLKALREYILEEHRSELWEGLEADDVMGILATSPKSLEDVVIYSSDKDMKTLPALLWDMDYEVITFNEPEEADYMFYLQTLTGDAVDGYPGCPGVGKVKARKALDEDCSWESVVKVYNTHGLSEEDALTQARLARILRYEDYDLIKGEVRLFSPSTGQ